MGEPEIHDADPRGRALFASDHDVLGLDVAVHDAPRVAVLEGVSDLDRDVDDFTEAERAVVEDAPERRPVDERHHEKERAVVASHVVDRDDSGVVHLRDDLRLALKPLLDVRGELGGREQLDGDFPVQHRVARPIDDSHAAAAQFGRDLVSIRELRAQHRVIG
jgi:hypothetical protein